MEYIHGLFTSLVLPVIRFWRNVTVTVNTRPLLGLRPSNKFNGDESWAQYLHCYTRWVEQTKCIIQIHKRKVRPSSASWTVAVFFVCWYNVRNAVFWDVDLVWTDVSEERIASILGVEKSASKEPAWAGGCRLSYQSKTPSYIRTGRE
jgi:hypothetical protein